MKKLLLAVTVALTLGSAACGEDETTQQTARPAAPSELKAMMAGAAIQLTWKDNSSDEDAFVVMKQEENGAYVELPALAANVTEYQDTAVTAGKMYMYMVHARRGTLLSDASNEAMSP